MNEISRIIRGMEDDAGAKFDQLIPLIQDELRAQAAKQMKNERAGHTLTVSALVNEAFLRLAQTPDDFEWHGRRHFFSAAAEAMRRILIDHARKRNSIKRGGDRQRENRELAELPLIETVENFEDSDILQLDRALKALESEDPEASKVVKLRFFAGLTYHQIADQLEISIRTAKNRWSYARAWLRDFIRSVDSR